MSDAIEVDLVDPEPPVRRRGPRFESRWVWLAIGFGLGLTVALLGTFSGSPGADEPGAGDPTTTTTGVAAGLGVSGEIPGFPDGLNVLVSPGEGRALEVLTWPLEGEPVYRSVPVGDVDITGSAQFDHSGHFLAATTQTPEGVLLQAGRPNTFRVVASGISGFAWHDGAAADLAWSKVVDGEVEIWVGEDGGDGELAFRAVAIGARLAAWGDWGYATVGETGVLNGSPTAVSTLVSPDGDMITEIDGEVVASSPGGLLLVSRADGSVIVPAVGIQAPDAEIPVDLGSLQDGVVVGGVFSRSGELVAVSGLTGITVIDLSGQEDPTTFPIRAGSNSLSWSSDDRFLLVSAFRGVNVIDTDTGEVSFILDLETTRAVSAVPIGGP